LPKVTHFEIAADDPDRLAKFYSDIFGWKFEKWEGPMDYWLITTGPDDEPGIHGGMERKQESSENMNMISVPAVDEFVAKIEENGGTIIRPKMAIPGVGWLAYFRDPDGNAFGIMQDDPSAR
jgi:predicted enzyme related to lactoylglutathione lyase